MTDHPPIPAHIWARLLSFLAAGHSGQFTLNVSKGRVLTADVREHVRENTETR